jgi:type I restriction enzyme S subunit
MKLNDIAEFVTDKISSSGISLDRYVTTDSLLQNRRGRETAQNLPPMPCALTHYRQGDVLVANIRPYLKKVWYADSEGGCSSDVLAFRAKNGHCPSFLYTVLMQDAFFDYAMSGAKGSKMPRGDKDQIMRYELPTFTPLEEENIGNMMVDIMSKINVNRQINDNLEAMAKQLYDYWFVQFDFPNEKGKPYKSNGGAMVWNEKLKREIPQGWSISNVKSLIEPIERGISYSSDDLLDPFATPMINLACFSKAGDYRLGEMKFFSGKVSNDKLISPMDMLIACTDMTQGADIIGRPILASDEYDQYTFSTDLALITPKGKFKMYLYYTLRTPFYHKYIRPFASGTTVKHLNLIGVENYGLPVPPIEIQSKFEDLITPIKEKQSKNLNEINALTKQRDELLPLLMNGQATVNYHLSAC